MSTTQVVVLSALLMMSLPIAVVAGAMFFIKRAQARWRAALANDPDFVDVPPSFASGVGLRTRAEPVVSCVARGGGKNSPPFWLMTAEIARLWRRTTVDLSREGMFGSLREAIGLKDVHLGMSGFDRAYTLRGSDPGVLRGVFSDARVQDAVEAFFALDGIVVRVSDGGRVVANTKRLDDSVDEAKKRALALQRLLVVLQECAELPALEEPVARAPIAPLRAASGESGAPVPVPASLVDHER